MNHILACLGVTICFSFCTYFTSEWYQRLFADSDANKKTYFAETKTDRDSCGFAPELKQKDFSPNLGSQVESVRCDSNPQTGSSWTNTCSTCLFNHWKVITGGGENVKFQQNDTQYSFSTPWSITNGRLTIAWQSQDSDQGLQAASWGVILWHICRLGRTSSHEYRTDSKAMNAHSSMAVSPRLPAVEDTYQPRICYAELV